MWKAESRAAAEEDGEKVWKWDMKGEKTTPLIRETSEYNVTMAASLLLAVSMLAGCRREMSPDLRVLWSSDILHKVVSFLSEQLITAFSAVWVISCSASKTREPCVQPDMKYTYILI